MPEVRALLAAASRISTITDEMVLRAQVNDTGEARVAACFYLSLAEQFSATLLLISSRCSSHAPPLLRSMLEGLVDLKNLVADPAYLDQIKLNDATEDLKTFESFANDPALLGDQETQTDLTLWRANGTRLRTELMQRGVRVRPLEQRLDPVELRSLYSAYRFLTGMSHSRLSNVIMRHAGTVLQFRAPAPDDTIIGFLRIAVQMLGLGFEQVCHFTNIPANHVRRTLDEVSAIWNEADDENRNA
jgi:hypothetical protein